jgi:predicted DNA-binding transcriptional regulator AlpA
MDLQQSPSLALLREMFPAQINIEFLSAAKTLGMAPQTAYNSVSAGSFPVRTFKQGTKRVCSILDLAATLDAQREIPIKKRRPGRPTNAERLTQQSASQ